MTVQIQLRRGTAASWSSNGTVVLAAGEPGFETDTGKFKVGDGTTQWTSLPYAGGAESLRLQDLSDVSSTAPNSGEVLKWNGSAWAPAADSTGGGGDGNTTYAISAETATGGVNLRLTGSDSSTDDVKLAEGSNVTITRTDANTITIAATGTGGGASNLDDLGDVVITGTPSNGQVLKYDSGLGVWVNGADSTGGGGNPFDQDLNTTDNVQFAGLTMAGGTGDEGGEILLGAADNTTLVGTGVTIDVYQDRLRFFEQGGTGRGFYLDIATGGASVGTNIMSGGGGGGGVSRDTASGTATSLADNTAANVTITGGAKTYALLKIEVSHAAWVRVYTDTSSRTADSSRAEGVDPTPGSGVIAEVITTGAETILMSPATIGFSNETSPSTDIPIRITNKSGSSASITVTLTFVQLEV